MLCCVVLSTIQYNTGPVPLSMSRLSFRVVFCLGSEIPSSEATTETSTELNVNSLSRDFVIADCNVMSYDCLCGSVDVLQYSTVLTMMGREVSKGYGNNIFGMMTKNNYCIHEFVAQISVRRIGFKGFLTWGEV